MPKAVSAKVLADWPMDFPEFHFHGTQPFLVGGNLHGLKGLNSAGITLAARGLRVYISCCFFFFIGGQGQLRLYAFLCGMAIMRCLATFYKSLISSSLKPDA